MQRSNRNPTAFKSNIDSPELSPRDNDADHTLESLYDAAAAALDGAPDTFTGPLPTIQPMQSTPSRPPRTISSALQKPPAVPETYNEKHDEDITAAQIHKMKKLLLDVTAHNSWLVDAVKTSKDEITTLKETISQTQAENTQLRSELQELRTLYGGIAPTAMAHQQLMETLSGIRRQLNDLRTTHQPSRTKEADVWKEQRVLVDALNQITGLFTDAVARNTALAEQLQMAHKQ